MPAMNTNVVKRELTFSSLEDAVFDASRLLTDGYRQAGKWNLAQVLGHCTDWLGFPIRGYPPSPLPIRGLLWMMKVTMGRSMFNKIVRERRFAPGSPTLPATVKHASPEEDAAALESFKKTVREFQDFRGQPFPSPLFGRLTLEEHRELQIIHLQHHLSHLVPLSDGLGGL